MVCVVNGLCGSMRAARVCDNERDRVHWRELRFRGCFGLAKGLIRSQNRKAI